VTIGEDSGCDWSEKVETEGSDEVLEDLDEKQEIRIGTGTG